MDLAHNCPLLRQAGGTAVAKADGHCVLIDLQQGLSPKEARAKRFARYLQRHLTAKSTYLNRDLAGEEQLDWLRRACVSTGRITYHQLMMTLSMSKGIDGNPGDSGHGS